MKLKYLIAAFVLTGVSVVIVLLVAPRHSDDGSGLEPRTPSASEHPIDVWINLTAETRAARARERSLHPRRIDIPGVIPFPVEISVDALPQEQGRVDATLRIFEAGPNLLPEIIERMRRESDPERLRLYDWLLYQVGRIPLYARSAWQSGASEMAAAQFLEEWDSGAFDNPEPHLSQLNHLFDDPLFEGSGSLAYYGIFGIPYYIDMLAKTNSRPVFSMVLVPTHEHVWLSLPNEFSEFRKKKSFTHEEMIDYVGKWWAGYHHRYNRLQPLYEKIDDAVGRLLATKPLPDLKILRDGPNLIPEYVEVIRNRPSEREFDYAWRILRIFGGIFFSSWADPSAVSYEERQQSGTPPFLAAWDAGWFDNPEPILSKYTHLLVDEPNQRLGDYTSIARFGIFALPFLLDYLRTNNSIKAFGLFGGGFLRPDYDPAHCCPEHYQKVAAIRHWWKRYQETYKPLQPLFDKIDAAVKALPDYPEEQVTEN
jgi:hypothetical protein